MGYSVVAAAGIVLVTVAVAGFHTTNTAFTAQQAVEQARDAAESRARHAALASATITSVTRTGGVVSVKADNTGAEAIDGSMVTLLLDGRPVTLTSRKVEGKTTDVWAPGQEILLKATAAMPSSASIASSEGPLAFWRA